MRHDHALGSTPGIGALGTTDLLYSQIKSAMLPVGNQKNRFYESTEAVLYPAGYLNDRPAR